MKEEEDWGLIGNIIGIIFIICLIGAPLLVLGVIVNDLWKVHMQGYNCYKDYVPIDNYLDE